MPTSPVEYLRASALLKEHGEVRSQPVSDWTGEIPLPTDVEDFYRQGGPVEINVKGSGNPIFFPSLANLWKLQAGYRWNGITGQHSADWHDEWLVVASHGGDPYIFDCSSGRILFARHGQGAWKPIKAFPNLAVMVACLATLGSIIRKTGKNLRDEDFCIRREHYQAAVTAISEIVGSSSVAERVVKNADWETAP